MAKKINIDYKFKDEALLEEALTHPSFCANKKSKVNYERLEFLGDAVLELVVSEYLYEQFPDDSEGDLAKRRAALVCGESLTEIARNINLGSMIKLGAGEESTGGRENSANLENVAEAIMGAIYLDGGIEAAREFILKNLGPVSEKMLQPPSDPKTQLQELLQSDGKPVPEYKIIEQEGPAHNPIFTVQVSAEGFKPEKASGSSKRVAEREAARKLLDKIKK